MIRHVYDALAPCCAEVLVSVREAETRYPVPRSVRHVVDRRDEAGPLAGLEAGLLAASSPWVLAVACDLPYVTTDLLRHLLDHRAPTVAAVVPTTSDELKHPLCAIYHRSTLSAVQHHLEAGQRALHRLLDALPDVRYIPVPAGPLHNVNTPQDVENSTHRLR